MLTKIIAFYLLVINLLGLFLMWSDKRKAIKGAWRIKESTLFAVALLGGVLGTTCGMYWFRHKTKHWYFKIGFPVILIAEVVGIVWVVGFVL